MGIDVERESIGDRSNGGGGGCIGGGGNNAEGRTVEDEWVVKVMGY